LARRSARRTGSARITSRSIRACPRLESDRRRNHGEQSVPRSRRGTSPSSNQIACRVAGRRAERGARVRGADRGQTGADRVFDFLSGSVSARRRPTDMVGYPWWRAITVVSAPVGGPWWGHKRDFSRLDPYGLTLSSSASRRGTDWNQDSISPYSQYRHVCLCDPITSRRVAHPKD